MNKRSVSRRSVSALAALALAVSLAGAALAASGPQSIQADFTDIKVSLNGDYLVLTDATGAVVEPFAVAGTTYLPVRAVAGALGLNVEWQAETSTVALTTGGAVTTQTTDVPAPGTTGPKTLQADYADIRVTLDGAPIPLTDAAGAVVEPFAVAGTTYLPVRAVAGALGLAVDWDAKTCTVLLTSSADTSTAGRLTTLVQGTLDALYLGKCDEEFLELVELTPEEVADLHQQNVYAEADYFSLYWNIVTPEAGESFDALDRDIQERILALIDELYDHAKYTVAPVTVQEDGSYTTTVTVSPIDVVTQAFGVYHSGSYSRLYEFLSNYPDSRVSGMSDAEYAVYCREYAKLILGLVEGQLDSLGYLEDETVTLFFEEEADGFKMSSDSLADIDALVIAYT